MPGTKQDGCHIGLKKPLLENILENIKNIFIMRFVIEIFMMKKAGGMSVQRPNWDLLCAAKNCGKIFPQNSADAGFNAVW